MRRNWACSSFALIFILTSAVPAVAQGEIAKHIVGTWRLVDIRNDKGEQIRGPHPKGLIYYDASGNMAAQIMPDWERPKFGLGKSTPEQAKAAIDGYSAYFGTYSVDEKAGTLTHHREGNINPGDLGDWVRQVEFREPNRLVLKTKRTNNQVLWERISK